MNDGLYRRSVATYATNAVVGRINEVMTEARGYLSLREQNEALLREKAKLEHAYNLLKRQVSDAQAEGKLPTNLGQGSADSLSSIWLTARIVNLVNRTGELYYIVNKGSSDGIRADMAVLSTNGVVGSVMETSEHYSVIIPIINPKLKLSCALKGTEYRGTLTSQGLGLPTILGGLPLHSPVQQGDTVLTSGYSYVFPEGMMVGIIEQSDTYGVSGAEAAFGTYRIRLATDFERLSYVYILLSPPMHEAEVLEQNVLPNE